MTITAFTEISHGTHRSIDLAEALLPYAKEFAPHATVTDLESVITTHDDDAPAMTDETEMLNAESVNDAIDALQDAAAPYCTIGMHEGDGSLLGCWPCVEAAVEDVRDGEVLGIDDTSDVPAEYVGHALQVNERGNVTLYDCFGPDPDAPDECLTAEVWACV